MRGELVAIDLETTGFDPINDAIIEVGAVRMKNGVIVETFSTLVNPGRAIPPHITHLTGIQPDDVVDKPGIEGVLPALSQFTGQATIIGHNIGFDLDFLKTRGVFQKHQRVDTYELASVLLPRAPRYSLASLTSQMGIVLETAHRALGDAQAAALLYWELWNRTLALPYNTLHEIAVASEGLAWDARLVFEAALRERQPPHPPQPEPSLIAIFEPLDEEVKPLQPQDSPEAADVDTVVRLLDRGGALSHILPDYEYRPQQIEMARAVVHAFNYQQHAMIEAGTGTGKSLAYLLPAAIWATRNDERVVISTHTINLQDQLMAQDIPVVHEVLNAPFRAAIMKGRGNYLCPRRLAAIRRRHPTNVDELRTLAKILVWLLESKSGDRGEINLRGGAEHITWQRLSAEDEGCTLERCRAVMQGACPFYKARKAAESAHLLVVNHALLISDAASENRVLPDYRYLVIDEAHHLEEATTNGLSFSLDEMTFRRRLEDLGDTRKGLLGDLLRSANPHIPENDSRRLASFIQTIGDATGAMRVHVTTLFHAIRTFASEHLTGERSIEHAMQLRITREQRGQADFAQIQSAWNILKEFIEVISISLRRLTAALARLEQFDIPDYDDLVNSLAAAARYLDEIRVQLTAFATEPDDNTIYWINLGFNPGQVSIHTAPLHVGPLVERYLWQAKEAVVLTSATLQTNGSFDYIRERLHAEDVLAVEVGTPFNYRDSTLIFIPTDMPEPNDRQRYQQAVERGLVELAAALNGRVLGLFTSYTQLRQTAQAIAPRLALGNITVYDQTDGSSRQALLEGFKSTERAVLLGTRSFWEGIDIPGEALSALVIVRLPFAVPTEPIFAARSETYTNSFNEYAVPDAILRFRQGFGRLIRTQTDRGVVTIFDSRILSKSYGMQFLEALPDCTVQYGPLQELSEAAKNWLHRNLT
jgi:DNA polymerase-3 subunit epsilon/ATP-dependent DNA helicase DinG